MRHIQAVIATRQAQLANATERANKAETSLKDLNLLLADRTKTAEDLASQLELKKQCNRLNKELLVVLQKLEDARKKLGLLEEKEKQRDTKVQLLQDEADSFESKYREHKKLYEELIREMDTLGIN